MPNAYAVLDFAGPMVTGADLTVQILQPDGTAWAGRPFRTVRLGPEGIVALSARTDLKWASITVEMERRSPGC